MKNLILASTSTLQGGTLLGYLMPELKSFFKEVKSILFIPYARPSGISFETYTQMVSTTFKQINIEIVGIHTFKNPVEGLENAEAIFVGGGNTFVLVNQLYKLGLMNVLKNKIEGGTPYLGTSAGSNICGLSMKTTNDMPIVYPVSYQTMGSVSFNINAHYLDPDPQSTHNGETRETRIKEFHVYDSTSVLGLREGSWLHVANDNIILKGALKARWFQKLKEPIELSTGAIIGH